MLMLLVSVAWDIQCAGADSGLITVVITTDKGTEVEDSGYTGSE
jgi:hypothetical protein